MNRELLSFMANDIMLKPLCKHPFLTAFLELHYSFLRTIQTKMRDCVAQMAVMTILLGLLSTHQDSTNALFHKPKYLTWVYVIMLGKICSIGILLGAIGDKMRL